MRAVVARVKSAAVRVGAETVGVVGEGLLVLLGVGECDTSDDARMLARKVLHLRIFRDEHRPMNRSVVDVGGAVLVVPQFTLMADTTRGRRPFFGRAAAPDEAERLYRELVAALEESGLEVETGRFGATMEVDSINDGPVTILLSTEPEDRI